VKPLICCSFLSLGLVAMACSHTPKTADFNKDGAIEVTFSTQHINDSFDVLTTTKNVYKQGQIVKQIHETDTLPTLGQTVAEGENNDGDTRSFSLKKEYNLFVTIK